MSEDYDRLEPGGTHAYHPCTEILIRGLKGMGAPGAKVLSDWDTARALVDRQSSTREQT